MILQIGDGSKGFIAGRMYRARPGDGSRHRGETRAVWGFLEAAAKAPVGLTVLPAGTDRAPELSDLPAAGSSGSCSSPLLSLATSGTTGSPKQVSRDLTGLFTASRAAEPGALWLLAYAPYRWAGVSVLLHVLRSEGAVVVPETPEPQSLVLAAQDSQASHISLTPSMLRHLMILEGRETLRKLPFRQITFGGETASQAVLDSARRIWPSARISHVYASTELGDICCVSDGLEGISEEKFSPPRFKVDEGGELHIDGLPTGDLWQLKRGRWYFMGRKEEQINVGGIKLSPLEIERTALQIEGVEAVRVYGMPSALLGQVVALDFVGSLEQNEVRRHLKGRLPRPAMPALIRRVERLAMTSTFKTDRLSNV